MEWNVIGGYDRNMSYTESLDNGVTLPELGKQVLFQKTWSDTGKDWLFVGKLMSNKFGLYISNLSLPIVSHEPVENGDRWAEFELPETENNMIFCVSYEEATGLFDTKNNVPYIMVCPVQDLEHVQSDVKELEEKGKLNVTPFRCRDDLWLHQIDYDYVIEHEIQF